MTLKTPENIFFLNSEQKLNLQVENKSETINLN